MAQSRFITADWKRLRSGAGTGRDPQRKLDLLFSKIAMRVGVKDRLARHSGAMDAAVEALWFSGEVAMAVEKYQDRTLNAQG